MVDGVHAPMPAVAPGGGAAGLVGVTAVGLGGRGVGGKSHERGPVVFLKQKLRGEGVVGDV